MAGFRLRAVVAAQSFRSEVTPLHHWNSYAAAFSFVATMEELLLDETSFDVIVVGTGIAESMLSS